MTQKLENFPNNLHTLQLGNHFNKKLENLPDTPHTLRLGYYFTQRLDELPLSICIINIFNKDLNIDSFNDKCIFDMIDNGYHKIINMKGMFIKSSNKLKFEI